MGQPKKQSYSLESKSFTINHRNKTKYIRTSWDSFNSKLVITLARKIYFEHLSTVNHNNKPKGVVINKYKNSGKVVYSSPLLLPHEQFIRTKYITKKNI
tara:strand:- start:2619 stop:2915 length:297 start_codon:yes stop_codon:yes gene_type:complete